MTSALEGGEGTIKADEVREASKRVCVKMEARGRGIAPNFGDVDKWISPYNCNLTTIS